MAIVDLEVCSLVYWSVAPSWLILDPEVDLRMLNDKRKESDIIIKITHLRMGRQWSGYLQIYTDGPKGSVSGRVACGVYIYLMAVLWAFWWVEDQNHYQSIICSDSAAGLTANKEQKFKSRSASRDVSGTIQNRQGKVYGGVCVGSITCRSGGQ